MKSRDPLKPLWFVLALLFLFYSWVWDQFRAIARWIGAIVPWERLKAAIAARIMRAPPQLVLGLFAFPVAIIIPFKLAAIWLITHGRVISGIAAFITAKFAGLGLTAFLFEICRDKLREMPWFVWLSDR
ncbi:MAG: hypothetical protein JOZ40_04855, partial [Methylobacteriaceae bacterium]|nr:hypothetical protein [Methylobacteriaceae bacterium]